MMIKHQIKNTHTHTNVYFLFYSVVIRLTYTTKALWEKNIKKLNGGRQSF